MKMEWVRLHNEKLRKLIIEELSYNIKEDSEQDNIGPSRTALYASKSRVVIESPNLGKNKNEILKIVKKHDPTHQMKYFDTTDKLVGNFSKNKIKALKRDLKGKATVSEKPLSKSLVKK
jgi:hypothetical protein